MRGHVDALSALIDDLFEFSRLEAGDIAWSMERVRLDRVVEDAVEAMRLQAAAKQVDVRASVPAQLGPAQAHPEQLQRVLLNLIQNAIRHTPADGSVTVSAEEAGGRLEVEVADTGDGIAEPERDRVFEPFFRGGTEAARTRSGAGLGLAISRHRRGARRAHMARGSRSPRAARACASRCGRRATPCGWRSEKPVA